MHLFYANNINDINKLSNSLKYNCFHDGYLQLEYKLCAGVLIKLKMPSICYRIENSHW